MPSKIHRSVKKLNSDAIFKNFYMEVKNMYNLKDLTVIAASDKSGRNESTGKTWIKLKLC